MGRAGAKRTSVAVRRWDENKMTARRIGLSKSRISAFEQCPKRLWLMVHRPELAPQDDDADGLFATGHAVGAEACAQCVGGIMVEAEPNLQAALETTRTLLASGQDMPIFEATFEHEGVLVRVDILEPAGDGRWHMAEVKSSGGAKAYHHGDLATQIWVAQGAGVQLASAAIRHIDTSFVLEEAGNYRGIFKDAALLEELEPLIATRGEIVAEARGVLEEDEPSYATGAHCTSPFTCEFTSYCQSDTSGPEWPVTVLPGGGGKRWVQQGIEDIFDLDPALLSSPMHQRVHAATVSGIAYHDVEGAKAAIGSWPFPRTWLDFETIGFALPRWIGMRPYGQAPFQFSAHIEGADGSIAHHEFLSLDGEDPRRACAEALIAFLPAEGAIIAYNAPFEGGCIRDLANIFPDLAIALNALADRLVDLLPVTRAHWYHRDQRGSWSIKAVLPTVAPRMNYAGLVVKDGLQAQQVYLEAIGPDCSAERRAEIDAGLRLYCGRDTEAMIVLARHLVAAPASKLPNDTQR